VAGPEAHVRAIHALLSDILTNQKIALRIALMLLGFDDVYHMTSMLEENPRDSDMWVEAYEAKFEGKGKPYGKEDWDQLLGHCEVCRPQTTFLSYSRGLSLTEQHLGRDGLARSRLSRRAHRRIS
jgi:hypothetical protein